MFTDIMAAATALTLTLFAALIDRKARDILRVLIEIEKNTRPPK